MTFTELRKTKKYYSSSFYLNLVKLFFLFFLSAYGQQAFAANDCSEATSALVGHYRICISSDMDTIGFGQAVTLTAWVETP